MVKIKSWEEAVQRCRLARLYHQAFTVVGKEVELDAIAQLMDADFGVREIARMTHIPRSTVSRLCRDLDAARRNVAVARSEIPVEFLEQARALLFNSQIETDDHSEEH